MNTNRWIKSRGLALASVLVIGAGAFPASALAQGYSVKDLLHPCLEGDADAQSGERLQAACDQYVRGFTDTFLELSKASAQNICLPKTPNRVAQIRWAFIKWAATHPEHHALPAAAGLLIAAKEHFPCN